MTGTGTETATTSYDHNSTYCNDTSSVSKPVESAPELLAPLGKMGKKVMEKCLGGHLIPH